MCGRFTLTTSADEIVDMFNLDNIPIHTPRFNIAPSQDVLTVCCLPDGNFVSITMRWGLIPHWASDPRIGSKMINARSETVGEKPAFRKAFQTRRCLIPADGFYEWQKNNGKVPHYIYLHTHKLFAFAGLWDKWVDKTGKTITSCTIITTTSNKVISRIHERMPVIIDKDKYHAWLDAKADPKALKAQLQSPNTEKIRSHPVSTLVNNPQNDLPDCIDVI